jgi:transcriptional regulator with XRE-family HTH domain
MPGTLFPADAAIAAGVLKTQRAMESNARLIWQGDAGNSATVAAIGQPIEQRTVQRSADTFTSQVHGEIYPSLTRPAVCGALVKLMAVGVADQLRPAFGNEPLVQRLRLDNALRELRGRRRRHLETDTRTGDVGRVYRRAGGGVCRRCGPNTHCRTGHDLIVHNFVPIVSYMTDASASAEVLEDRLSASLAATLESARVSRRWSVNALARASGVSRTMISKIEHGDVQPTAALLARLSGALGMTLSELISSAEGPPDRVSRRREQHVWTDPETSYVRRAVSPTASEKLQLVEVELPGWARVPMPRESYLFIDQQIWVLAGQLHFIEGEVAHDLRVGDCLQLGEPQDCVFENRTGTTCRYLVALRKR